MKTNFGIITILMVMGSALLAMEEHPVIALLTAACEGDIVGVRRILRLHDNVNAKDGHDRTALLCAAINDHDAIGELLLARGANATVQIIGEWPILKQAIRREHEAKCKLYIDELLNESLTRTLPYLRIFHLTVNQKRQLNSLLGAFKRTPMAGLQPDTRRMIVQDLLLLFKKRMWIKCEIDLITVYFNEGFRKVLMAYLDEQLPSMKEGIIVE